MPRLIPLYSSSAVRNGEQLVARSLKIDMYKLMERAGEAVFEFLSKQYAPKHLFIACGSGNNAGDGYVVGRLALERGIAVTLFSVCQSSRLKGDAVIAHKRFVAEGGITTRTLPERLPGDCIVVDALLGTGLTGELRNGYKTVIDFLNNQQNQIVSIDVPSGLNSDTGACIGSAIVADHTITFIGRKQGLYTAQARRYSGEITFSGLGIEEMFDAQIQPSGYLIDELEQLGDISKRLRTAHKGSHGKALLIGGNRGMAGAIILSTGACLRTGAGLTATLTNADSIAPIVTSFPEAMPSDWYDDEKAVSRLNHWATCIGIGPGLGTDEHAKHLFFETIKSPLPKVMDADALRLLAKFPNRDENRILTPHPGEAALLLDCMIQEIESDRFTAVRQIQSKYGGVALLKGAGSLVCDGQRVYVCGTGNPGMATGGMGDVLTGVITGLLAQGESTRDAALKGMLVHSIAADIEASEHGEIGLLASDVLNRVRSVINQATR